MFMFATVAVVQCSVRARARQEELFEIDPVPLASPLLLQLKGFCQSNKQQATQSKQRTMMTTALL